MDKIDWSKYKSNASNYEENNIDFSQYKRKENEEENSENNLNKLQSDHPFIYGLAEKIAQHPKIASLVKSAANSPITEAGLSTGPALANAYGNMINFPTEITTGNKIVPKFERHFEEPKNLSGKIGSTIGDIVGKTIGFIGSPLKSATISGALATGAAQGEGGIVPRSLDALVGLLLPGILHTGKLLGSVRKSKLLGKDISNLELQKAQAERGVFGAKEALANKLSNEIQPIKSSKEALKNSLEDLAGNSDASVKQSVGNLTKKAEKDISKKYNNLYEGFNEGEGGQSLVKDPIKIENLSKDYGLSPDDFSNDSKKLIEKLVGKSVTNPEGKIISPSTGKVINQSSNSLEQAKPAKVEDYVNLWKQLRAEVAEYKHSSKLAQTPEAKRTFREKANQLEKLSDDVNLKSMKSLTDAQQKEYSNIQKGYLNERVPFLEKPLLKNATDKFPEIPDNYFEKLNNLGVPDLLKTFQKEHPELVNAITKHDIRNISQLSTSKLKELINGDFGKFIPKNIKDTLNQLHLHKSAQELLTKALGKVNTSEIGRKVKASDINDIIKSRPDLSKPFTNVEKEQKRLRGIKDALVDTGFKLKDAEEQLKKYKKVGSIAKLGLAPAATYLGISKSKRSNSDENNQ